MGKGREIEEECWKMTIYGEKIRHNLFMVLKKTALRISRKK